MGLQEEQSWPHEKHWGMLCACVAWFWTGILAFRYGMAEYLPEILSAAFGIPPDNNSEGLTEQFKERPFLLFFLSFWIHVSLSSSLHLSRRFVLGLSIPTNSVYFLLRSMWSPLTMFLLGSAICDFVSPTLDSCYFFLVGWLPSRFRNWKTGWIHLVHVCQGQILWVEEII